MERTDPMIRTRRSDRLPGPLAGLVLVAALALSLPAAAAKLVEVRLGAHPAFTRVVFELDGAAGYRVEEAGTEAAPMLRVSLDAGSRFYRLRATGDVRDVKVTAGTRAVATIALRKSGLRVREMILSNPHRIVLDLYKPESALAKAGAAKKTAAKKPTPKPVPAVEPAPEPVAEAVPAPVARTEPAPKPALAPTPTPPVARSEPKPAAPPALKPAPRETARADAMAAEPADAMEPARDPMTGVAPAIRPAPAARTAPTPERDSSARAPVAPTSPPRRAPAPAKPVVKTVSPAPSDSSPSGSASWMDRLSGGPVWMGAAAAALVALVLVVLAVRHRRRALPNDLDVTAIAEEVDGAGRNPAAGFAMDEAPTAAAGSDADSSFAGLFDDEPAAATNAPAPREAAAPAAPAPSDPAPMPAGPEPAASAPPDSDTDSLFDDTGGMVGEDDSEGEAPMNQDMDLPVEPGSAPPPVMGGAAAASPDVMRVLEELERRIGTLEGKLDEANEAREKLERQVAAQSEELRVQRAAIARTQRALRTMSRADEDKATEPALREGDTQAKTRVNV